MSAPAVPVADASKQAPTNQATTHDVPPPRSATSASNPTAEPRPVRDAPPPNISRMARSPGADELNRAANARNAEARAAWLWRAVGKGNPQAPVELARMYEQGNGVVRSCDQARVLLRVAAAKGNEEARRNLQLMRIRGGCSGR
jgi:TPR repeat protein